MVLLKSRFFTVLNILHAYFDTLGFVLTQLIALLFKSRFSCLFQYLLASFFLVFFFPFLVIVVVCVKPACSWHLVSWKAARKTARKKKKQNSRGGGDWYYSCLLVVFSLFFARVVPQLTWNRLVLNHQN